MHAYRQAVGEGGRERDGRQAGDVYRQGANIAKIHLEWVVHLLIGSYEPVLEDINLPLSLHGAALPTTQIPIIVKVVLSTAALEEFIAGFGSRELAMAGILGVTPDTVIN